MFCWLVFGTLWVNMVARILVVLGTCLAVCLQYLLHFLVDETAVRACHRLCQMPVLHMCLLVHKENDAIGQFVLIGSQRAHIVAKTFGQHRDGTVHQIDTCATLLCLAVDNAAFCDIVRHIGNVHSHLIHFEF